MIDPTLLTDKKLYRISVDLHDAEAAIAGQTVTIPTWQEEPFQYDASLMAFVSVTNRRRFFAYAITAVEPFALKTD